MISTDEDKAYTKTFEKFCKLYILKNGGDCVNKSQIFFLEDCGENNFCKKITLKEKADIYKAEYKCFGTNDLIIKEVWNIHRMLLEEANRMIKKYNHLGYKEIKDYPPVRNDM